MPRAASESTAASRVAPGGMVTGTDSPAGRAQPAAISAPASRTRNAGGGTRNRHATLQGLFGVLTSPPPAVRRDSAGATPPRRVRPRRPSAPSSSLPARARPAARELGGSTRGRKDDVDALAAAVLLQHYLDARRGSAT